MGILTNLVEPGAIVVLLTVGALINRRPKTIEQLPSVSSPLLGPRPPSPNSSRPVPSWMQKYMPDNTRFETNLTSRFLATFPFLVEILYWNLIYWIYQLARAISALTIVNNEQIWDTARSHALAILSFESKLHLAIESPFQKWTLESAPWLMSVYAIVYYSHIIVFTAFYVYAYSYIKRASFQTMRRTWAAINLVAFVVMSVYGVMPPRLLPERYGFVDVLHPEDGSSGSAWTHNKFQLTIAAMPSMHFGMAGFIAYSLLRFSPHRFLRVLAVLWPMAILCTILATANHFLLDAFVGALVVVVAWNINEVFLLLCPCEEWLFWLARTMKPLAADQDPPSCQRLQLGQEE